MKNKITLSRNLKSSRIVHGHWRLSDWDLSSKELLKLVQQTMHLGITTFDHADIYGNYTCERIFGDALRLAPDLRKDIQIITKCGIKLISDKYPDRKHKYYDYSYQHIVNSVEQSLKNFNTNYIDLLLLHRPSPFFNPEEVARAFSQLKKNGKVLNFGVSNFNTQQFELLDSYVEDKLVTNQVEISPLCLEHFENGNIDYFLQNRLVPMAWSPLTGGEILYPKSEKAIRTYGTLSEVANELNINSIDKIIYSWLLSHPVSIIPVVGTSKIERLQKAVDALKIEMTNEQWLRIYSASTGKELP
ncbi:MAG: aldo/keto reductase [Bacteroidetes bacterium]|nr:aldo/keto reductase [Bacteroidota bacterium]